MRLKKTIVMMVVLGFQQNLNAQSDQQSFNSCTTDLLLGLKLKRRATKQENDEDYFRKLRILHIDKHTRRISNLLFHCADYSFDGSYDSPGQFTVADTHEPERSAVLSLEKVSLVSHDKEDSLLVPSHSFKWTCTRQKAGGILGGEEVIEYSIGFNIDFLKEYGHLHPEQTCGGNHKPYAVDIRFVEYQDFYVIKPTLCSGSGSTCIGNRDAEKRLGFYHVVIDRIHFTDDQDVLQDSGD